MALVLVADDEYAIVEIVLEALEMWGHECISASNGRDAIERATERRPELIIMDIMMPIMDGREALGELRRSAELAAIPVILMSAAPRRAIFNGSVPEDIAFLQKPFDLRTLERTVKEKLGTP